MSKCKRIKPRVMINFKYYDELMTGQNIVVDGDN